MDTQAERLRLLFPDLHGLERGKYLFGDVAAAGKAAFCVGVYPLTHDKEILPVPRTQFDVGLHDVEATLDRDTLRPGWERGTTVGIADVELHGEPAPWDPRHILREAVAPWRAMGLEPQMAFELEFYLLEPADEGTWRAVAVPSHRVYGTGTAVDPTGVIEEIVDAALACQFPVEGWCSEFDDASYEVNIRYRDAIPAADEAFLFKLLVREVVERRGMLATFLGRPLGDRSGSGLHVNLSFRREDGSNAFHDPNGADHLSDLARSSIAGLLTRHRQIAAVLAPHVNAYRRLQPDMLNGYWANWGHDDRTVTVRVPPTRGEGTRLEHRTSDAAANPYLAAAAILHAARLGVERGLDPPPRQRLAAEPNTDVCVPANLKDALDALERDAELVDAIGREAMEAFVILKRAEWDRFVASGADVGSIDVTDWELAYYLPYH
ncbi:MAG: glutamine synthetase family protein [Actinomycetota bacterium]